MTRNAPKSPERVRVAERLLDRASDATWIFAVVILGMVLPAAGSRAEAPSSAAARSSAPVWLSLAGTVAPLLVAAPLASGEHGHGGEVMAGVLTGTGLVLGPSLGHFYAGCDRCGWTGVGIRASIAAVTAGIAYASSGGSGWDRLDSAEPVLTIGALAIVGHAVYDISTASRCTERRRTEALRLELSPGWGRGQFLIVGRASF